MGENNKKTYPLHKVVHYRNIKKIKILLPETKNINEKDENGQTVLLIACEQETCNDAIMELLLSHENIDPTVTNRDKFNALHMLAFKGNLTWIKKVCEKFPNMPVDEITDKGNTPLIQAAKMDHLDIIRYLHSKGADINHENSKKFTALEYAANNGYEETTKELLNLGASINHKDDYKFTPLMKAASWGFTEVCRILLDHGADREASNDRGQTALSQAVRRNSIDTVKILLEYGANANHVVSFGSTIRTPLGSACFAKNIDMINMLIEHGAEANVPNQYSIPLLTCIKQGFAEGVKALIDAGVDVGAKNQHGKTALDSAKKYRNHEIVKLLEKAI